MQVRELCEHWQGKMVPPTAHPQRIHGTDVYYVDRMITPRFAVAVLLCCASLAPPSSAAEEFTVATYNIERFNNQFEAHRLTTQPVGKDPANKDILDALRKANDEDKWETAQVILDPKFNPDILVIEEGCDADDLKYFNRQWLKDAYETVMVFPTNTDRNQSLCLLMKKGFQVLDRKDKYYLEPDPVGNERGGRLFARGPAFVKVRTPAGYVFWVGVTHMKSKNVGGGEDSSGKSEHERQVEATKWRNREAARTHEIMKQLESAGPKDVMLLGDMNDAVGLDDAERDGGGDAVMNLVGPPSDGFILATKPLADAKVHSFNGYWRDRYRQMIDHIVISKSMANQVSGVRVFNENFAPVASDHFPVMIRVKSD